MTWVTDLSHFIDERTGQLPKDVPGPARRNMEYQTRIVAAATRLTGNSNRGTDATEPIRCRRRLGRRPCSGIIEYRVWSDERIRWQCPECGENGIISNWQSTAWDNRSIRPVH